MVIQYYHKNPFKRTACSDMSGFGLMRYRDVMVNLSDRQVQKSPKGLLSYSCCSDYFFDDLLGFKSGVFPGVFLLSR